MVLASHPSSVEVMDSPGGAASSGGSSPTPDSPYPGIAVLSVVQPDLVLTGPSVSRPVQSTVLLLTAAPDRTALFAALARSRSKPSL